MTFTFTEYVKNFPFTVGYEFNLYSGTDIQTRCVGRTSFFNICAKAIPPRCVECL